MVYTYVQPIGVAVTGDKTDIRRGTPALMVLKTLGAQHAVETRERATAIVARFFTPAEES